MLGAVSQFEKAALAAKLKAALERKKAETGKCGGRRSVAETNPATVALAKKLARYPVNGRRRSLRDVAAELESRTFDKRRDSLRRGSHRQNDRLGSRVWSSGEAAQPLAVPSLKDRYACRPRRQRGLTRRGPHVASSLCRAFSGIGTKGPRPAGGLRAWAGQGRRAE